MTTTPTIWKAEFYPYSLFVPGSQTVPQTVGLANGNILAVWEDDTLGPSPGVDIMGRILTPEGDPTGAAFQVNNFVVNSDETGPKIVALPDGGYVVVYGSYSAADGGFIVVQRYNGDNQVTSTRVITDPRSSLTKWEITADAAGNYTVAYERLDVFLLGGGGQIINRNVFTITYDHATNVPGPERYAAQNSEEHDDLGAVAAFPNGHLVTLTTEPDDSLLGSPVSTTEFKIFDPLTGSVIRQPTHVAGESGWGVNDHATALAVEVLTGGEIAMLYHFRFARTSAFGFSLGSYPAVKICAGEAPGSTLGPEIRLPTNTDDAQLVALADGGFFVAWSALGQLSGARYTKTGALVGEVFSFGTGNTLGRLSLTSDGRILVPYGNAAGEIAQVILDPRDNKMQGTDAGEVITTQIGDTLLFGQGGDDTLLGQIGNDELDGGFGADFLHGGYGADTLEGGPGRDRLLGGLDDDVYVLRDVHASGFPMIVLAFDDVVEGELEGIDTVRVERVGLVRSYTLTANVEIGVIGGVDAFDLAGNELHNRLTGNMAANTLNGAAGHDALNGGGGDDTILGAGGRDTLDGGEGADRLEGGSDNDDYKLADFSVSGGGIRRYDTVVESPGEGRDTVHITALSFMQDYVLPANVEDAFLSGTFEFRLVGNELDNVLVGNVGRNVIQGLGGRDSMNGSLGADQLLGGAGNDHYNLGDIVKLAAGVFTYDTIVETAGQGIDSVQVTALNVNPVGADGYTLGANVENGSIVGSAAFNLTGNALANELGGSEAANTLNGFIGNDSLFGRGGGDTLIGSRGADVLTGGLGADRFRFLAAADSSRAARDRIDDFSRVQGDKIDVSAIDANSISAGNQAFAFVSIFTGAAGQLRAFRSGGGTFVEPDVNGDRAADLSIVLTGLHSLVRTDFIL